MTPKLAKPNPGNPEKSALLVIDVQRDLFEQKTPIYRAELLITNILDLVEKAHAASVAVIYVQHQSSDFLIKGSQGWQLHPDLSPQPIDWYITKEHSNAFEEPELGELLTSLGVGRLVITGLVTHGCVKNNCLGALKMGYQVVLAGDAHSSFSKDAFALIEKWNKALAEKGVKVLNTAEISFIEY
jgi:nicotinamidase-related amidase